MYVYIYIYRLIHKMREEGRPSSAHCTLRTAGGARACGGRLFLNDIAERRRMSQGRRDNKIGSALHTCIILDLVQVPYFCIFSLCRRSPVCGSLGQSGEVEFGDCWFCHAAYQRVFGEVSRRMMLMQHGRNRLQEALARAGAATREECMACHGLRFHLPLASISRT